MVLDQKGRITIPSEVRSRLGLKPGSRLELVLEGDRIVLRPARRLRARDLLGIAGQEEVELEDVECALGETS
ncbi:AbrB/MazE/SpoVT family DNA-binding domain-containing protein [Pyrodictium abyssi]|uniref:AbrB/MazE/SpoVT family DNA-binding domain-containing protein n=1 Tax=Pyrodictium abyssi TaxID=54256 RepID=UPI0030C68D61